MGDIADTADLVWRDNDGATPHKPVKSEIRDLFGLVDDAVGGVTGPPGPAGPQGPVGPAGAPGDITNTLYFPPGAAAPSYPGMLVDTKLDEIVSVTGWMKVPYDSAGDHTTWLLDVIEKVNINFGGAAVGLLFPHPIYNLSDILSIPYDNIYLIGRGCGEKRGTLNQTRNSAATRIVASASFPTTSGKALIEWQPADGTRAVIGGGASRIFFEGGIRAARTLASLSHHKGRFTDLQTYGGTEVGLYLGPTLRTLTSGDYATQRHVFDNVICHHLLLNTSTAYGMQMSGNTNGVACINTFRSCTFVGQLSPGVRWENSDFNHFDHCQMTCEQDNNGTTITNAYGMEIVSAKQTASGVPRYSSLQNCVIGPAAGGLIVRAGDVLDQQACYDIFIFHNNADTGGGPIMVETATNGARQPHLIVHDNSGVTVYGAGRFGTAVFNLKGIGRVMFRTDISGAPATEAGLAKLYMDASDDSLRVRHDNGIIRVLAPGPADTVFPTNVILQKLVNTLTNFAGSGAGTLTNAPTAGNPSKWIKIDDNGTPRYIPCW